MFYFLTGNGRLHLRITEMSSGDKLLIIKRHVSESMLLEVPRKTSMLTEIMRNAIYY